MKALTSTVAKFIFGIPFLVFGFLHLMSGSAMAGLVPSFIPGGVFWVYLTGLGMIAAAISIFINKYTKLACLLLAALLMIFVLTVQLPGLFSADQMVKQMSMVGFLKDFALTGGALLLAGISDQSNK